MYTFYNNVHLFNFNFGAVKMLRVSIIMVVCGSQLG